MTSPKPANLATVWEEIADRIPDEVALVHGGTRLTWRQFEDRAARLASAFQAAGLGAGARVAIDLYNCPQWLEAFFAAIKIRAVPANVNYRYLDQELLHLLTDCGAEAIVYHASFEGRIARLKPHLANVALFVQVNDLTEISGVSGDKEHSFKWAREYELLLAGNEPAVRMERSSDDQFLAYTGGTTGLPKGVIGNLGRAGRALAALAPTLGITHEQAIDPPATAEKMAADKMRFRSLPASPLMHATGFQMTALPTLTFGGTVVTLESHSFNARELLDTLDRERVRMVAIVGDAIGRPFANALRDAAAEGRGYNLPCLELISSAGVAFSADVKTQLLEYLPRVRLFDSCGTSEGCTYGFRTYRKGDTLSGTNFMPTQGLLLLDGEGNSHRPVPGTAGILAATTTAAGYYNDPEKTARTFRLINGTPYVIPGDYGRIEDDGSLTLLGRGSTTINTGGEKVHPEEVEDVIKDVSGIDDCLVLGLPDDRWGQCVTALVQRSMDRQGADVTEEMVISRVHGTLANYKAPKHVFFIAKIPRGPNGKPDYVQARKIADQLLG